MCQNTEFETTVDFRIQYHEERVMHKHFGSAKNKPCKQKENKVTHIRHNHPNGTEEKGNYKLPTFYFT